MKHCGFHMDEKSGRKEKHLTMTNKEWQNGYRHKALEKSLDDRFAEKKPKKK